MSSLPPPPAEDAPLMSQPARAGVPVGAERRSAGKDVALVPASDEDVIVALGRAFHRACARLEQGR